MLLWAFCQPRHGNKWFGTGLQSAPIIGGKFVDCNRTSLWITRRFADRISYSVTSANVRINNDRRDGVSLPHFRLLTPQAKNMSNSDLPYRISQIQTLWTVVCRAEDGESTKVTSAAQEQLLALYGKAVYRYLLGELRDSDAADELYQEFALRFIRGDLGAADPTRGRFRDYLKGVLSHLVGDYYRRKRKQPLPMPGEFEPADVAERSTSSDEEFLASWRNELLNRAWLELAELQQRNEQPFHTVLHYRAAHPDASSDQMACA